MYMHHRSSYKPASKNGCWKTSSDVQALLVRACIQSNAMLHGRMESKRSPEELMDELVQAYWTRMVEEKEVEILDCRTPKVYRSQYDDALTFRASRPLYFACFVHVIFLALKPGVIGPIYFPTRSATLPWISTLVVCVMQCTSNNLLYCFHMPECVSTDVFRECILLRNTQISKSKRIR